MKILSYHILNESDIDNRLKLQSYLSNVNDIAKNLSKDTGIKLKTPNTGEEQNLNYEYNINNVKFRFYSDYNDVTTTRAEHAYAFYDNKLHIVSNRRQGDNLVIEFEGKKLTELTTGIKYKIKNMEGHFQSITDRESFEYFELLDPKIIRQSRKKENANPDDEPLGTQQKKTFDFNPNANVDMSLSSRKGDKLMDIKGSVRIESLSKGGYKYRISTKDAIYILTLDKPFNTVKNMVYNVKLASKTDGNGTIKANNIILRNNQDIKYS
jgi:hypothetical protein